MVLPDALTYFFSILNDLDVEPATSDPHLGVIMHGAARFGDLTWVRLFWSDTGRAA
jgi:hypothetical protein